MNDTNDDRLAILADPARPPAERRAALDSLAAAGAIPAARAQGLLPAAPWPAPAAARVIGGDELILLAVCTPEAHLAQRLGGSGEERESLVLAVRLAAALARFDPASAGRLEPLVRELLADTRHAFPHLPEATDSIGAYTQEFHRLLIAAAAGEAAERRIELIEAAILRSLARGREMPALYNLFHDALRLGAPPGRLAGLLLGVLAERSAAPAARLGARLALDVLAGLASHPDGAPAGMAETMAEARAAAGGLLAAILRDPDAPAELREAVAARLHRDAPQMHQQLQREGVLPARPIPSRREHKAWSPAAVELLASQVRFDEVLSLLAGPPEPELDRVITALRLAPSFAAWLPGAWAQLAPRFVALFSSRVAVPMKSGPRPLGGMVLELFPQLFPPLPSQSPEMQEVLREGLARARAAGLDLAPIYDWLPGLLTPASRRALGL